MRRANWWVLAAIAVGAVAGFAVVGRGTTIPDDMSLTLDSGATTTTTSVAAAPESTDAAPTTTVPPLPGDQAAARIVIAVTQGWEAAALGDVTSALTAEGFTNVITETAQVASEVSRVRVGAGFDTAAAVVLRVLGLSSDAIQPSASDAGSAEVWSALDAQADVLVLLGTDLRA